MGRTLLRLGLGVPVVAAAILTVSSMSADGPDGERSARAADPAEPLVDPAAPPGHVPHRPHVILLILDEFPGDSLIGSDGQIDAVRYPNLAALARNGYWFPNATTVYDSTPKATPLILDGKRPRDGRTADFRGHPRTIFDLLGRHGYRVLASEEATAVCPPRWCRGTTRRKPDVVRRLTRGRIERLRRFFGTIKPGRPTLWMKHTLLPHGPYEYLPSGKRTRRGSRDPVPGMSGVPGFHDAYLTDHNHQRYLLQLGFVDREIGKLLRRLVRLGMFDQTMVVITADHGFAWEVGVKDRRKVTRGNVDEIAPVPLFIKAPGQRKGMARLAYVNNTDIVPTIADLLNFRMPYRADGRSAFSAPVRARRRVRMLKRDLSGSITVPAASLERRRRAIVARRNRVFGVGDIGTLYTGIGPNRQLLGRTVAELAPNPPGRIRATIAYARDIRAVNPRSVILPTHLAGPVRGGRRGARRDVAVAVNGRVEAVGRTFYLRGSRQESFAVNVPESSLRPGRNAVAVFEVRNGGRTLQHIGGV